MHRTALYTFAVVVAAVLTIVLFSYHECAHVRHCIHYFAGVTLSGQVGLPDNFGTPGEVPKALLPFNSGKGFCTPVSGGVSWLTLQNTQCIRGIDGLVAP